MNTNQSARPHMPTNVDPGDFHRIEPATRHKYEHCNACPYLFKKDASGRIDMTDFRRHKQTCDGSRH